MGGVSADSEVAREWAEGWSIRRFRGCEGEERLVAYPQISWLRGRGVMGGVSADFVAARAWSDA